MIKSLRFSNFKGFESLEVPEIAPITIIGGKNNVGKSSLLEGIHLFYDSNNLGMFMRHLSWRAVPVTSIFPDAIISPIFYDFDIRKHLKIELDDGGHHASMAVSLQYAAAPHEIEISLSQPLSPLSPLNVDLPLPPNYTFQINYEIDDQKQRKRNILMQRDFVNVRLSFDPPTIEPFPEQMRHETFYIGAHTQINKEDIARFAEIGVDKRVSHIIDFLQIVEPQLTRLQSYSGLEHIPVVYADVGMRREVPLGFVGDAINRLFLIIVAIATAKNGVVLIDEIDDGIHHSFLLPIWEYLSRIAQEYDCQIIATTHNYENLLAVYNAVAKTDMIDQFRYVRLDKRNKTRDRIVAKTYTHEVLGAGLDLGWEVR